MDTVHVLVWGTVHVGPCAWYRGHQYDEPLRELGIEMRHIEGLPIGARWINKAGEAIDPTSIPGAELQAKVAASELTTDIVVDTSAIDWADVVMFRRYYNTAFKCVDSTCHFRTLDEAVARKHEHAIKMRTLYVCPQCDYNTHEEMQVRAHPHPMEARPTGQAERDTITREIWAAVEASPDVAVLYDTDDLHIGTGVGEWNGFWPDIRAEESLIYRMVKRANLVTVSTPRLARPYASVNPNTRVVRNSIDPSLYVPTVPRPEGDKPRVVYYGGSARLRDYAGFPSIDRRRWEGGYPRMAVEEHRRELHSIFLGADDSTQAIMRQHFDEVRPYVVGIPEFARELANTHGDIGLAPLMGDSFDACKSELHWLEYAACGVPTIATRFSGGADAGPYNLIRDGVDGILAKGRQDWYDGLRRLLRNPNLRSDIAAAAKERVLRDYDYRQRAREWADAFRACAERRQEKAA